MFIKSQVRSGFSLMEIMIAITIMALLGAFVGPALYNYLARASTRTAEAQLKAFKSAIDEYERDMGDYPEKLENLVRRPSDPELARMWMGGIVPKEGGYLRKIPRRDPWKVPYVYKKEPYKGRPYTLYSYGPKKRRAKDSEKIHIWNID